MTPYIDFHNHSIWHQPDVIEVVSIHGLQQKNKKYYTIGYHPWWTEQPLTESQLDVLETAYANDPYCLGIGEFGLDKLKGANLDMQAIIMEQQLKIASKHHAPIVLHCVRSFERALVLRKKYDNFPWVNHGFVRNKILAKQVLDAGIHLSLAPHLRMTPVFEAMLKYVPLDRIFIETDSEFHVNIQDRYRIFAEIRQMSVDEIKEIVFDNFTKFYSDKWKYHGGLNEQLY
ncbi:MAG: TatD family hydrolase [Chitinophagales bacterium]|nr:TatD family hydrolase [Chitinophagales bacterium]